ncbi:MAG TPA: YaiI/YqxD family protein [Sneathiellales bacterium]|nr:YaiI/YqxD family protein [Sneathiellales bacterium]
MTEIYVDGDACPVKDEVVKVAARHGVRVHLVSNRWLRGLDAALVNQVVVAEEPAAAAGWIADHIGAGDIAITADILLAARCVEKEARVLGPTGKPFTDDNIGMAVAMRDLKSHLRETGEIKGYNPGFTQKDRSRFLSALDQTLRDLARAS